MISSSFAEQLTLNLALGIIFVLITLVVLIARKISSPANIPQAVCKGPGFESLEVHQRFYVFFFFPEPDLAR